MKKKIKNYLIKFIYKLYNVKTVSKIIDKIYFKNTYSPKLYNRFYTIINYFYNYNIYYNNKNLKKIKQIRNKVLLNNNAYYLNLPPINNQKINSEFVGNLRLVDAILIYDKIKKYINLLLNQYRQENIYLLQLGSASGRNLLYFKSIFKNIKIIYSDVDKNCCDYQIKKNKFKFYKIINQDIVGSVRSVCYISRFKKNKVIIFSSGSINLSHPLEINLFALELKKLSSFDLFISEPISLEHLNLKKSNYDLRNPDVSYAISYNYQKLFLNFKIINKKLILPHKKTINCNTGILFIHFRKK